MNKHKKEFDCGLALERLIRRHSCVRDDSQVVALLAHGLNGIEEDCVLEVVQDLVIRPDVGLAALGCFRPILAIVLDTLVHSLRQIWRQGRGSPGREEEGFVGVSSRLRNGGGWDLGLHEYVCIMFSRLLDLAPYLISSFLQYFEFAPPPYERLLHGGAEKYQSMLGGGEEVPSTSEAPAFSEVVYASYRLLQLKSSVFRELWDWSPFLDLLRSLPKILDEASIDVRWCGVQIVSQILQMSDKATLEFCETVAGLSEEHSFQCHLRWRTYCQRTAVEKLGMYLENPCRAQDAVVFEDTRSDWSLSSVKSWKGSNSFHLQVCGIDLPVRQHLREGRTLPQSSESLVLTPTVKRNLEAVVLALSQRCPVLLEGPIGSGKSSLIQELAYTTGNLDLLFIHLDDQMDSKTLLGNYACTEIPGEFKWQPGALTQAVVRGMWVVFEDIDRAPFEIFSALIPLLEDRKLYIPGRGEMVPAADNFRIFSTVTRTRHSGAFAGGKKEMLGNLWRKVVIDAPNDEELADIIRIRFPSLSVVVPKLISTFNLVKQIASQSESPVKGLPDVSVYVGRQFSTRDLFKWCTRVSSLGSQVLGSPVLSSFARERIYVEAADCFGASIASTADRHLALSVIGRFWNIPEDRVSFYLSLNKPSSQKTLSTLQVGRVSLLCQPRTGKPQSTRLFANTGHAVRTLEAIAMCVQQQEPVLLVGETGTGKTSLVQHLAWQLGMPLVVLNMSQQTDSADFLGGFKPVEAQGVCVPLLETFNTLFRDTYPTKKNADLLEHVQRFAEKRKWDRLLKSFRTVMGTVSTLLGASFDPDEGVSAGDVKEAANGHSVEEQNPKRKRPLKSKLLIRWRAFTSELRKAERQVEAANTGFAFSFVEGVLVKAIRNGHWLLLDEVNLAPVETLERLTGVLEGAAGTLSLTERGDVENVSRHPNFRIFACMNPATDFGKRDLPISLRNRFTELYIDELTQKEDLQAFVFQYLENSVPSPPVEDIVNYYLQARHEAGTRLLDGANQKPQYSLRSLARALEYTCAAMSTYGFLRSLYDGICMSFLTLLDRASALVMEQLIYVALFKNTGPAATKALKALLKVPPQPSPVHVLVEHIWVESGNAQPSRLSLESRDRYVLTKTITEHLKNLARAVFVRKYPVLLQGPTSSGKTSLVEYLATITGHRFVRINNHEHTDLQEYLGSYVTDSSGKLVFQEGALVEAVRKGYWIVLDELNLAPSDVLEALNRLLDDNRELFIPELQLTVKPHPHFMLFATQNPPGIYGGRKVLSRAFRNRFMELHIDDIPDDELCMILEKRCQIPGSYAAKMIEVMKDLQRHRQGSKVFAGKHGFITARDLFRWAERHGNGYEELARDGYMLLAERLRNLEEKEVVQRVLEKHMRVKLDVHGLHNMEASETFEAVKKLAESPEHVSTFGRIVWTKSMKRLFNLVEHCIRHCEPVLLVGETGCGKTMVCQLLSLLYHQRLHILNCHQHSETSDFLGGLRPIRDRDSLAIKFQKVAERITSMDLFQDVCSDKLPVKIEDSGTTVTMVKNALSELKKRKPDKKGKVTKAAILLQEALEELSTYHKEWQSLFVWYDGPLVQAMRSGDMFLVDEISLAEDSVLERLNSVLEPKRLLVLAEKGGSDVEELIANSEFRILATMNPGGDFGKKELSPALRNRFTEVWVPPINDIGDLRSIAVDRFSRPDLVKLVDPMLEFWQWFQRHHEGGRSLSVRDLLSWITYINVAESEIGEIPAFIHGAFLVLLDGIGFGLGLSNSATQEIQAECTEYLFQRLPEHQRQIAVETTTLGNHTFGSMELDPMEVDTVSGSNLFGMSPFHIARGDHKPPSISFALDAPTTKRNAWRILRAMQLHKPVLIEGSPGVGKTSLVAALAAASGHALVRINLSEQTDIMDLLGSDMPVEGGTGAEFQWSDGVFLQALKAGHWVLLDELNLASQSVLEGLNACLDHRGELFIPELGRSFKCPSTFRVFACQNPFSQGGGRKGLPKSFLNRFTKVYVDALSEDDFVEIASILHPSLSKSVLKCMIKFNSRLHQDTMVLRKYGHSGSPWEFNLRDILRWCELMEKNKFTSSGGEAQSFAPEHFLDVMYLQRMRTVGDRRRVLSLFQEVFGTHLDLETFPAVSVLPERLQVGLATLPRRMGPRLQGDFDKRLQILPGSASRLEAAMHCVSKGWMCILVGPPASGKTSLVRLMAALTGNSLLEFTLSSATDTTELLGCFEQHDLFRRWQEIVKMSYDSLKTVCSFCLSGSSLLVDLKLNMVKSLLGSWAAFQKICSGHVTSIEQESDQGVIDPVVANMLLQFLDQLRKTVASCGVSVSDPELDPHNLYQRVTHLRSSLGQMGTAGRFEWVDGGLLKAIERGEWVVLENANFCNPTVLDRLNPLLEPGGSIMVNERGLVEGEAMVVHAHPNFRLFLTVDPAHGEVSRAMRNRGVELFMLQSNWPQSPANESPMLEELLGGPSGADLDSLKILTGAGVPGPALLQGMCRAHFDVQILTEITHSGLPVSLRELSEWVSLLQQLLDRGGTLSWSLACSWEQVYSRRLDSVEARQEATKMFQSRLGSVNLLTAGSWKQIACCIPGGWPSPLSVAEYCLASKEAMVLRDTAYLEYLGAQLFSLKALKEWPPMEEGRSELLRNLKDSRTVSSYLPASLLSRLLNPEQAPITKISLPDVKTQDLDLSVLFASLWMLEQGSYVDLNLRIQWLGHLAKCSQGSLDGVERVVAAVERETVHPLSRELSIIWEKYLRRSENHDVSTFSSLVSGFVCPVSEPLNDLEFPEERGSLGELVFRATRLQVLRRCLLQWEEEDEQYRMTEMLGCVSTSGVILQSFWQHKHRADRSRLLSPQYPRAMLIYLHPLFSALRELENSVLLSSSSSSWGSIVVPFSNVQEWHETLWIHLSEPKFNVEGFLFHWGALKRGFNTLASIANRTSESVVKAIDEVKGLIKLIDEPFALGENPLAKPHLWKYAGHPGLPHSRDVHDLEVQVLKICDDLGQSAVNEEIVTICTDGSVRQLATTGLSIVRWLGQDSVTGTEENANAITPDAGTAASLSYSESLAIYQMLKERVKLEKLDVVPLGDHDIIPLPQSSALVAKSARKDPQCASFPKELLRWPSAWALWAELLPWLSNISICQNSRLIAEVTRLARVEHASEESLLEMLKGRISEDVLRGMIEFAVSCSSRSPTDLVPHQHLLWLLDGTHPTKCRILTAFREVSHELVYRWHSSLWKNMLTVSNTFADWSEKMGPARIFYASQTVHFAYLLGRTGAVRDHYAKLTQLKLASVHVWAQAKQKDSDVFVSNVCTASAIFQQFIFAHGKSFHEDEYKRLVTMFSDLHSGLSENMSGIELEILGNLSPLLMQSQHTEFLKLVEPLVLPCMKLLYSTSWKNLSFSEGLMILGRVWLYLGELRLYLLLPSDGCDPVAKYSHKYAHLTTQSSRLDLDIKVREESEFLVRGSRHSPKTQNLLLKLEQTKQEMTSLALKLVPRPEPPQFRNFLNEVLQFMKSSVDKRRLSVLASDLLLVDGRGARTLHEVATWQENAMQFISRLALEFPAYRDVVQPVQLAVYELKFGLSLLQAGSEHGELLDYSDVGAGENDFVDLLSSLMRFPTVRSGEGGKISAFCTQLVTDTTEAIISKVTQSLLSGPVHREVLDLELKVMVMRVAILRCSIDTQLARVKAKDVVKATNSIFSTLASLWSEIRERQMARDKEEEEFIRFTARTHTLETEDELEEASFREMFVDFKAEFPGYDDDDTGMLSAEMDDKRAEAALKEKDKAAEDAKQRSDKAWLKIQEPLIQDVVSVHRHIFGRRSTLLNIKQGAEGPLVSDWERENAFSLAYQAGVRLLGAVGYRVSAQVEDSLVASHIMQVGIEHRRVGDLRLSCEHRSTKHNIYKDSNPPEMALMLEPVRQFLERVSNLLVEWPDHPILTQFLSIAKALVGISLEAPIMKALTGIELLLSKAQLWEENSAKHVSLAREMNELMKLVRRWRKLELESWPALIECTLEKHEQSAEKLWFFLHGLLHRQLGEDFNKEMEATISSLEEFMQTSPLGEFSSRLDLLSSFHGQFLLEGIYNDPHAGASRIAVQKLCNILYNIREYYLQFLLAVEEAAAVGKAPIEKELKGFVKLTKWEDRGYYALALSAEKTHRKLHKLIRKYDEVLKKPAMEVLSKQSLRMGSQSLAMLTTASEPAQIDDGPTEKSVDIDNHPVLAPVPVPVKDELSASSGSAVITAWNQFCGAKVAEVTLMASGGGVELPEFQRLPSLTARMGEFLGLGVFASDIRIMQESCLSALDDLSTAVIQRSAELRKGEKRLAVKKKALIDLLRALRDIGLSHHKSAVPKDERNVNSWFQQSGSDSAEVLMSWARQDLEGVSGLSNVVSIDAVCSVWTRSKVYYFQNVALSLRLGQNALDFNKALSLREVEVSSKYMEHLLFLQRKQRHAAFDFSSKLSALVHLSSLLSGFSAENSTFPRQERVRKTMWLQKCLLDSLCHAASELALLYRTSEASQRSPDGDYAEVTLLGKAVLQISRQLEVCKNSLDQFLVPRSESIGSRPLEESWPLLITPAMQQVVLKNFVALRTTETQLQEARGCVIGEKVPGLSSLQLLFIRALDMANNYEEEFASTISSNSPEPKTSLDIAPFTELYGKIVTEILLAVQNLRTNTANTSAAQDLVGSLFGESEGSITIQDMDISISKKMTALRLGKIYDILLKTVCAGAEMIDSEHGNGIQTGAALGKLFGCICAPLQILEAAGAQLLADYVDLQKTVSKLGYVLSNLFCSLYSEGFCLTKEQEGDAGGTKFEDADGTGMGEGEGQKDVSDQIEEEDQLLNSTEKNEDIPKDDTAEKKQEKGIEMEQDFDADMLDLSDDESDEENENEEEKDEKLESQMGEEGEKSEVVDEQLWKGEDDKNEQQQQGKEKQEKDAGMSGAAEEDLEMRAKEESNEDSKGEKGDEKDGKEKATDPPANEQENHTENGLDDEEGLKEDEAYEDPTGVNPRVEEELELPEDLNLDGGAEEVGQEGTEGEGEEDMGQEGVKEEERLNESEPMDVDDNASKPDEDEDSENKNEGNQEESNSEDQNASEEQDQGQQETGKAEIDDDERDLSKKEQEEDMQVDFNELQGEGPSLEQSDQPELPLPDMSESAASDSRASGGAEAVPAGVTGRQGDPIKVGQDDEDHKMGNADAHVDQSRSELQASAAEDILGDKRSTDQKSMLSDEKTKKRDRPEANANRSLGDALKKWKEMVQMLDDSSAPEADVPEDKESLEETAGAAYEYVPKEEAGSAQALGAATDDQLTNTQGLEPEEEVEKTNDDPESVLPGIEELQLEDNQEGQDDMEGVEATHHPLKKGPASDSKKPITEDRGDDDIAAINSPEDYTSSETMERRKEFESLISLRMPQASEDGGLRRVEEKPLTEEELREIRKDLEVKIQDGDGSMENARVVWQKLEQMTVRLSQELAEQLRLILEPTLAAKLQGDYRSGKRINMKKIIPYVASQFRKDKIWLRRTKANKRQYQIVLAIDDSRSMSESHCGHMALEALITICKAMSQLEIGEMAVASFGEKGNVRLLHDFDQPFSTESGLNMVSQFTFKQDNTIEDEPIVDLLQYLTRMLDFKARHSAAPSGRNDLQQLVLVIADGRFHEKESLRRRIREAMDRKQLLAFLVLDNPQESILDMQSVSFTNGTSPSFTKYLDSFPFPYYILLQDIESLPRTLADLLRQWFELTQRS